MIQMLKLTMMKASLVHNTKTTTEEFLVMLTNSRSSDFVLQLKRHPREVVDKQINGKSSVIVKLSELK